MHPHVFVAWLHLLAALTALYLPLEVIDRHFRIFGEKEQFETLQTFDQKRRQRRRKRQKTKRKKTERLGDKNTTRQSDKKKEEKTI